MTKFVKKPVEIEAWLFDLNEARKEERAGTIPEWVYIAIENGTIFCKIDFSEKSNIKNMVKTLEGEHIISNGDYIVRGIKGELYPCKPDIFEKTYWKKEDVPAEVLKFMEVYNG